MVAVVWWPSAQDGKLGSIPTLSNFFNESLYQPTIVSVSAVFIIQ